MIVNGYHLLNHKPIKDMLNHKIQTGPVTAGLSEAGYDIRIKQDVRFLADVRSMSGVRMLRIRHRIDKSTPKLGNFCLASAIEEFHMPDNLVGIVHDKSSWARQGLSVFNTVVESGWKGYLTLELVYHGSNDLFIPAGSGIAQVVFHQTSEKRAYDGRYQNQEDKPVSSISL